MNISSVLVDRQEDVLQRKLLLSTEASRNEKGFNSTFKNIKIDYVENYVELAAKQYQINR